MAAEARLSSPLERISFLQTSFGSPNTVKPWQLLSCTLAGLGMFYLFLCGLAVGSEAWEIMLGRSASLALRTQFSVVCSDCSQLC